MKFTQIPTDTFQKLALNAGIMAYDFNPSDGTLNNYDIIGATSGGVTITAVPTFADFGEDIDNCPKNTKELKRVTEWEITASGTFVTLNNDSAVKLVGAGTGIVTVGALTADTDIVEGKTYYTRSGSGTAGSPYVYTAVASPVKASLGSYYEAVEMKVTPRHDMDEDDFGDIWFVGDYSDKNTGSTAGFVACHIKDALSNGGFSFVTSDGEKAKMAFEFKGHYSIDTPQDVPFEVYVHAGS